MSARVRLPHKVARELDRELRADGFVVGFSGRGHIEWRRGNDVIRAPSSPSDWGDVRKRVMAKARRHAAVSTEHMAEAVRRPA